MRAYLVCFTFVNARYSEEGVESPVWFWGTCEACVEHRELWWSFLLLTYWNCLHFDIFVKKVRKDCFLGLRVFGVNLRYRFTGGAEAHNGTPDGKMEQRFGGSAGKKHWGMWRRLRQRRLALRVDFVSRVLGNWGPRSLKLMMNEEICGRFGSFRWINLFISR